LNTQTLQPNFEWILSDVLGWFWLQFTTRIPFFQR
jgi:hypothetical protein